MKAKTAERQILDAYDQYADAIFRHCALRVNDRERGKDLMQDTFLRTFQSLQDGVTIENMRAFLYRVANNLIIDGARRNALRRVDSLETLQEAGFDIPDAKPGPLHATETSFVISTLEKLEEPYRTAIVLRYIDGFSPSEIASFLGETANVVSVRINRGLKKLSGMLS